MKKYLFILFSVCAFYAQGQTVDAKQFKKSLDSLALKLRTEATTTSTNFTNRLNWQNTDRLALDARVVLIENFLDSNTIDMPVFKKQLDSISLVSGQMVEAKKLLQLLIDFKDKFKPVTSLQAITPQ